MLAKAGQPKACASCRSTDAPFYKDRTKPDGLTSYCRTCTANKTKLWRVGKEERRRQYQKGWRDKNPQKTRRDILRRRGLTPADYERLLESQLGCCAICDAPHGKSNVLVVDHDHTTGRIRGLVCRNCNSAMGMLRDNPDLLRRAAAYLERKA